MEFQEVVKRRRMVRHFVDEPVDRAVLERIAAAAQRAPSAGFSQGQRVVVIADPAARKRIAGLYGEEGYTSEGFDPFLSESGALIIPCVSEQVYRRRYHEPDKLAEGEEEMPWDVPYWYVDIGCTIMLILLAAVDEGLAAGLVGTWKPEMAMLRTELGIPEEYVPVAIISVGRQLPDKRSPSLRRGWVPFEEFARWDRW